MPNKEKSDTRKRWRVYGTVAGRHLPETEIVIGPFTVGPLPKGVKTVGRVTGLKPPESPIRYISHPNLVQVDSHCYFWIDKLADDPLHAIDAVVAEEGPLLAAAFSLRGDSEPHQIEVLWATDGQINHGNGAFVYFIKWDRTASTDEQRTLLAEDFDHLAAIPAGKFWAAANQIPNNRQTRFLAQFKAIEWIASEVARGLEVEDLEARHEEIVIQLRKTLNSRKSVGRKVGAVWRAEKALRTVERHYLVLKVQSACQHLMLSDDLCSAACDFAVLRNRLSHPNSLTSEEQAVLLRASGVGAGSVFQVAREMLKAYVDHFRKVGSARDSIDHAQCRACRAED